MTDRLRVCFGAIVGAAAGGLVGYLCFTDDGRRARRQIEAEIDDWLRHLAEARGTVRQARAVVRDGIRAVTEIAGARASRHLLRPES